MKREVFPVKMSLAEIFDLFYRFTKPAIEMIDSNDIIFFKVGNVQQRNEIEKILMLSAIEYNKNNTKIKGKRILSNRRKPLFLRAYIIPKKEGFDNMWRFEIYQPKAKGIIIDKYNSLLSYPDIGPDLSIIILMMTNHYLAKKQNQELEKEIGELKLSQKSFEDSILSLDEESLWILFKRSEITLFEKNQVLFTYKKLKSSYEENASKIDDLKTYNNAINSNSALKPILEICEKISFKFGFDLPLL